MEQGPCNVIYTDRRAKDEHLRKDSPSKPVMGRSNPNNMAQAYFNLGRLNPPEVTANVDAILSIFGQVYVCSSGRACLARIASILNSTRSNIPTYVIIDIPYDEEQRMKRLSREPRTPSPTSARPIRSESTEPDDIYAIHLLTHIASEISSRNFSSLVVPVVMLSGLGAKVTSNPSPGPATSAVLTDTVRLNRYLDAGAVDILPSPLPRDRVSGLVVHAYRAQKEFARQEANFLTSKKNRKLSWVGVDDSKPYAYLREAMVSNLMTGICNPETVSDSLEPSEFDLNYHRREMIEEKVGMWSFSAHDFTDDELLYAALVMLEHTLQMPELENWVMGTDALIVFLLASRTAYNEFVKYHNFRHVIDVLQALFHFLVRIGTLPPYPQHDDAMPVAKSPIASLLKPFDALTLLISAIGHDVGHPGVNNAFLVALNAPLAQLYNDRSVLESFHCAAYSQILRRYWPTAFADAGMRKLMINNILATDMGLHFKYMSDLGNLQEKLAHDKGVLDGWSAKVQEEHKDLTCGLLIKCADICNVARKFETAAKWANILTDEFSNQGLMEQELQMPSCLFGGPPVRDDVIKLGESQVGFMNIFARPLFESVADILPAMGFAVDEILYNKSIWEKRIDGARQRKRTSQTLALGSRSSALGVDHTPSPHATSPHTSKTAVEEDRNRRASTGSLTPSGHSRHASGQSNLVSHQTQGSSRRGSVDPSLTAILVTHSPNGSESVPPMLGSDDCPRGDRKDTLTRSSSRKNKEHIPRPVTAPSQGRRSQIINLYPLPQPAPPNHMSEVDLSHTGNEKFNGSKPQPWDNGHKMSDDSDAARLDASRHNSSWWRQMGSRRATRDARNGDLELRHQKELMLDSAHSNSDSNTTTATCPSPGRKNTTTSKIKSFFKRKPAQEQEKPLSSFGSSSQLRTPPTSDPGRSMNSDD